MYKLLICLIAMTTQSVADKDDQVIIENGLKTYAEKVKKLKQNIDNSVFNDTEILLQLDFETAQIIAFVQDNIAFQPYQGLLRGVQGTLNSRAGNALDQSVLLAKLLNDAGLEARIASGQLTDQQSVQLLSGMSQAELPQHIGQGEAFENALEAIAVGSGNNIEWTETETFSRYKNSKEHLAQLLNDSNIELNNKDVTEQLVQQNKSYFWVQYRTNPTMPWQAAHPAFTQAGMKAVELSLEVMTHFKDAVPEQYLHQLKVEAFIEQRVDDKVKQHSLMKPWIKPVANLQDQLITFSNTPSGVSYESDYDLTKILNKSSFFAPTFNGNVGKKVFDLNGQLVDADAANAPAGALFKTLGDKSLSAAESLSSVGAKKTNTQPLMQLNSQWLQFTFMYPDGTEYVQKRYIYQASLDKNVEDLTVKTQLMTEYAMLVNSGEKPNAYLAQVYLELVESGLPLLKSSAKKVFNPEQKVGFPKQIPRNEFELLTQYYWMQQNPDKNINTIQFRSTANLLGFKRGYINPETAFVAVDVVANKQAFFQQHDGKFYTNAQAAMAQGVWETASEWIPSQILELSGNSIDTLKVIEASKKQNIALKVFQSSVDDKAALKKVSGSNTALFDRLMADLNQGYVIAMPAEKPNNLLMTGWWRIDPETGETLGMIANGGGSELTEYLTNLTNNALTVVRAVNNLKKCNAKTNDLEKLCCLAEAHFNNVGGLAFGEAFGGAMGTAGAALFSISDFTTELVTERIAGSGNGSGITPSTNGRLCAGIEFPEF